MAMMFRSYPATLLSDSKHECLAFMLLHMQWQLVLGLGVKLFHLTLA